MLRQRLVVVGEAAGWAGIAFGVWLLTLSSVSVPEVVLAAACSAPCGAAAVAVRRVSGWRGQRAPGAGRWLWRLPIAIVTDTAKVLALPWSRLLGRPVDEGTLVRVPVQRPPAPAVPGVGLAIMVLSMSPGSFAVDDEKGTLVVHALVGGRWSMDRVLHR